MFSPLPGGAGQCGQKMSQSGTFGLAAPDTIFLIDELDTLIGRLSEGGILTYQVDEIYVYTKQ